MNIGDKQMANGQDFDPSRQMRLFQARMPSFVQNAVFIILIATTAGLADWFDQTKLEWGVAIGLTGVVLSTLIAASIKVANQWERGIVLRLAEFQSIRGSGLFLIVPIFDRVRLVDTRVLATDIPSQEAITRDNVPVGINGALFQSESRRRRGDQDSGPCVCDFVARPDRIT